MRWESPDVSRAAVPPGYTLRLMGPSEVGALTGLQNSAFEGSWGYAPNTVEQIGYRLFRLHERPDEVVVLEQSGRLVAYCWTHEEGAGHPGHIEMVGVHPLYQSKGLGRIVTGAGIDRLLELGARPIGLNVDSANSSAVRMYEGLGFELDWVSHWYELRLS
jgi:mycothiol synthase